MPRVKRGPLRRKKRRRLLARAKAFYQTKSKLYRAAKEALLHAWTHMFADRKKKKRNFRRMWTVRINAASREHDISYSKFIHQLKGANIELDRKILSDIAEHHPDVFKQIVATK